MGYARRTFIASTYVAGIFASVPSGATPISTQFAYNGVDYVATVLDTSGGTFVDSGLNLGVFDASNEGDSSALADATASSLRDALNGPPPIDPLSAGMRGCTNDPVALCSIYVPYTITSFDQTLFGATLTSWGEEGEWDGTGLRVYAQVSDTQPDNVYWAEVTNVTDVPTGPLPAAGYLYIAVLAGLFRRARR